MDNLFLRMSPWIMSIKIIYKRYALNLYDCTSEKIILFKEETT